MPLFRLSERVAFPPANLARSDGLLCIGGDLSPKRLILAYENGIFPWSSQNEPILWWSPDPRLVLIPSELRISRSLKKKIRKHPFDIKLNTAFEPTILACAQPRPGKDQGTWLVDEMIEAYITLHQMGVAHSIEAWEGDALVGGLYGVSLGRSFFGESMFSQRSDASKICLVALAHYLMYHHFDMIDCQITTDHLLRMGAREVSQENFLTILNRSVRSPVPDGIWRPGLNLTPADVP